MKVYRITNFIIVALVIAAIYQTGELWLEGTSGHNFFYALAKQLSFGKEEADGDVLLATRYAVGEGEGTFSVYYPDNVGNSTLLETANKALGRFCPKAAHSLRKQPLIGKKFWRRAALSCSMIL
ncbi:MAG: hypothetical protein V8Q32_01835 [Anaerotignum faecicola]